MTATGTYQVHASEDMAAGAARCHGLKLPGRGAQKITFLQVVAVAGRRWPLCCRYAVRPSGQGVREYTCCTEHMVLHAGGEHM